MHSPSAYDVAAVLVVLAAVLGFVNYHLVRLPHTIGLTVFGSLASLAVIGIDALFPALPFDDQVRRFVLRADFSNVLLQGLLSFLLFAGALHVDLGLLVRRRWTVTVLATLGVVISTALVAAGFKAIAWLLGFEAPFVWCLVFGALISPTDPIAVLGILASAGVPKSLEAQISGESLFNDGVGIVLFTLLLGVAGGEAATLGGAAELFAVEAGGGLALGLALGGLGYAAMRTVDEHNLEVLITLALVMGGYALAQKLHVSGPIAMATTGLIVGNPAVKRAMSDRTRVNLLNFWSLLDEMLNSVLFLLIGLEAIAVFADANHVMAGVLAVPLVLLARAVSVGLPFVLFARLRPFPAGTYPLMVWGGLRGGISIALALSLPDGPLTTTLLTVTYVVVVFSVVVQGTTVGLAARRLIPQATG